MDETRPAAPPYAPPTLRALGTVHELTQAKGFQPHADAFLFAGQRTGRGGGAVNGS